MAGETQSEFIVRARDRFRAQGKLFLVDDAKFNAIEALLSIVKEASPRSLLVVAEDATVASELSGMVRTVMKECETVTDMNTFAELVSVPSRRDDAYRERAATFAREHPVLVFSAVDGEGKPLLHRTLCEDNAKSGAYYGIGGQGSFCISDFLSECRYEFVAVDAVFSLLAFCTPDGEVDPLKYDYFDFVGQDYYTDRSHSYRRLKQLTGAAKQCVVLSDTLFEHDAAELCAALELLYDPFSFVDARTRIRRLTEDYEAACELVYNDVNNCKSDDSVLSGCVQRAQNGAQHAPRDISTMDRYLETKLKFSSQEEVFLKAMTAYIDARFGGRNVLLEEAVDSLERDMSEMVECFLGMYLHDTVKGELESVLQNTKLSAMSSKEIEALFSVFERYGVCHKYGSDPDRDHIVRLYCDDSGFESTVTQYLSSPRKGDTEYSFVCGSDRDRLKCYILMHLLTGKEAFKLELPALIVTRDGTEGVVFEEFAKHSNSIKAYPPETFFGKDVMIADYSHLRRMAKKPSIRSAVFYDFIPDLFLFTKIRNKISGMGDVRIALLCDDIDFSATLVNEWRREIFSSPFGTIPFGTPEIETKKGLLCSYSQIIEDIADCYVGLRNVFEGETKAEGKKFTKSFLSLVTSLTENAAASEIEIETDMRFFSDTAKHAEAVFGNAVTPGRNGETVVRPKVDFCDYFPFIFSVHYDKEKKKVQTMPRRMFFNVCSRYLYRLCDVKQNDCNGCPEFERLRVNDLDELKAQTEAFFTAAEAYGEWRKKQESEKRNELKINDEMVGSRETLRAVIRDKKEEALAALREIEEEIRNDKDGIFEGNKPLSETGISSVAYIKAAKVLEAVSAVELLILAKYMERLLSVFGANNQLMRTVYTTVCEGLQSGMRTK